MNSFEKFGGTSERDPRQDLAEQVYVLLENKGIHLTPSAQESLAKQIDEKGKRHLAFSSEIGGEKRFVKIMAEDYDPNDPESDYPFRREVGMGKFLKDQGFETPGVLEGNANLAEGTRYAIMGSPEGAWFPSGFQDIERLTPVDAEASLDTLETMHEIEPGKIPAEARAFLQDRGGDYEGYSDDVMNILNEEGIVSEDTLPADVLDRERGNATTFYEVMNRRFGIHDFKERVKKLLDYLKNTIETQRGENGFLVHGDLAPNNLYRTDKGRVGFHDLEWMGVCDNRALATVFDVGNLRARAWNNQKFRDALDASIIRRHSEKNQEEVGRAIVALSILRSHLALAGFFENYDISKQRKAEERERREATEADLLEAWKVVGLDFFEND